MNKLKTIYRQVLVFIGQWVADRLGDYPWASRCEYCGWEWHGSLKYLYDVKGMMQHDCTEVHKKISDLRVQLIREFNRNLDSTSSDTEVYREALSYLSSLERPNSYPDGFDQYTSIVQRVADEALEGRLDVEHNQPHSSGT